MGAGQILQGANTVLIVNPFMNFGSNIITADLAARWAGTDGTGTTLTESVAGRNGTLTSGPTWAAGPKEGTGAVVFDGSNDYVTVPHNTALQPYPFTLSMWVKTATTANWGTLIVKMVSDSQNGFMMYFRAPPNMDIYYYKNSTNLAGMNVTPATINNNSWHHLAVTVGASGMTFYYDGSSLGTNAWSGTPGAPTSTAPLLFGIGPLYYNGFAGSLADVRIYSAALSAANIALIAAGNG